jgi:hypothetical protein
MKQPKKLILKYNAILGKDHLPEIRAITKRLSLEIESVNEESPVKGKKIKVIAIKGDQRRLHELDQELIRFPSIATRLAS